MNTVEISDVEPTTEEPASAGDDALKFADLKLQPEVLEAVVAEGYETPTEIQAQTIPLILEGRDVIGQANTGTGKTAAFALPLLCRIDTKLRAPQVIVLAPTRELAIQVAQAFEIYAQNVQNVRVATIYGGQSYGIQIAQLKRGSHIVVGTPGRVIDHIKRGNLNLGQLRSFVLDEADEMLKMGFADDVQWILGEAPDERQTLLFSATMPAKLSRIVELYLNNPANISATQDTLTTSSVHQRACLVSPREKLRLLSRILESEQTDGVIIFVKTKETSSRLAETLCQRGFQASALNGDMAQQQRERTVERLKSGQLNILVATDVAARGLDVDRITHVINYDFPADTEAYVHRIGRTGRAGREGQAIVFISPRERRQMQYVEKATGQKITWMLQPTNEEIEVQRSGVLQKSLKEELAKGDLDSTVAIIQKMLIDNPELELEQVAAGLARMIMQRRDVEGDAKFSGSGKDRGRPERGRRRDDRGNRRYRDEKSDRGSRNQRFDRRDGEGRGGEGGRDRGRDQGRDRRRDSKPRRSSEDMVKYRIEVGYTHGVKPGNIVGAITSESGLRGSDIGGIDINTNYTTVDLPAGLSEDLIRGLQQLRVAGQPLRIREWKIRGGGNSKFDEKPRSFNRRKQGKPTWKKGSKKPAAK